MPKFRLKIIQGLTARQNDRDELESEVEHFIKEEVWPGMASDSLKITYLVMDKEGWVTVFIEWVRT